MSIQPQPPRFRRTTGLALALLVAGLVSAPAAAEREPRYEVPEIPAEFADAPAIVLFKSEYWVVVPRSTESRVQYSRRVLIRSARGLDEANQTFAYDAKESYLEEFEGRTICPDGTVAKLEKSLRHDELLVKGEGEEMRAVKFAFSKARPGCIVEWNTTVRYKGAFSSAWWHVQEELPVLSALFVQRFEYLDTFVTRVQQSRRPIEAWCTLDEGRKQGVYTRWEARCRNVPAFSDEPLAPAEVDSRLRIQFRLARTLPEEMRAMLNAAAQSFLQTEGIVQNDDSEAALQTPVDPPTVESNTVQRRELVTLNADGSALVEGRVTWSQRSEAVRRKQWRELTPEARTEAFLGPLAGLVDGAALTVDPIGRESPLEGRFRYTHPNLATRAGDELLVPAGVGLLDRLVLPRQEKRQHPVAWGHVRTMRVQTVFRVPDGFSIGHVPPQSRLSGPGLEFEAGWERGYGDRAVVFTGRLVISKPIVETSEYPAAREFALQVDEYLRQAVVLAPAAAAVEAAR